MAAGKGLFNAECRLPNDHGEPRAEGQQAAGNSLRNSECGDGEPENGRRPFHDPAEAREEPCPRTRKLLASCPHEKEAAWSRFTPRLQHLIAVARQVEEVELIEVQDDLPADGLMRLVQEGGSFSFLADPREDVYTLNDLKVRYT